jgi:hypothetical protein
MKHILFISLMLCSTFIISCKKDRTETVIKEKEYKKFTLVRTDESSASRQDSLIIELNDNLTLKSTKEYSDFIGNVFTNVSIQSFFYSANSTQIDSSVILATNRLNGTIDTLTEKYLYEGNNLKKVFKPVNYPVPDNEIYEFAYDASGKITHIFHTSHYHQDTLQTNTGYIYTNNNLSSATDGSLFSEYDSKINPLNYIYRKTNYPFFYGSSYMLPLAYCFSENNPGHITMDINGVSADQKYKYNEYNFPTEITSNWCYFNFKFYYE